MFGSLVVASRCRVEVCSVVVRVKQALMLAYMSEASVLHLDGQQSMAGCTLCVYLADVHQWRAACSGIVHTLVQTLTVAVG